MKLTCMLIVLPYLAIHFAFPTISDFMVSNPLAEGHLKLRVCFDLHNYGHDRNGM